MPELQAEEDALMQDVSQVDRLTSLPTELILAISSNLPLSSLMLLRRTSRRLRDVTEIEDMPEDMPEDELRQLQRVLDRDGCFSKRWCKLCDKLHAPGQFTQEALSQMTRSCLRSVGSFWLSPAWSPGYEEMLQHSAAAATVHDRSGLTAWSTMPLQDHAGDSQHLTSYYLLPLTPVGTPSEKEVSWVLEKLGDVSICPHLRFRDMRLVCGLEAPIPQRILGFETHVEWVTCRFCDTRARLWQSTNLFEPRDSRCPGVYLTILRGLRPSLDDGLSSWLASASQTVVSQQRLILLEWWREDVVRTYLQAKVAEHLASIARELRSPPSKFSDEYVAVDLFQPKTISPRDDDSHQSYLEGFSNAPNRQGNYYWGFVLMGLENAGSLSSRRKIDRNLDFFWKTYDAWKDTINHANFPDLDNPESTSESLLWTAFQPQWDDKEDLNKTYEHALRKAMKARVEFLEVMERLLPEISSAPVSHLSSAAA